MSLGEKDFQDIKLARPVSVLDLWGLDDRITRLEEIIIRLERAIEALILLHKQEMVKGLTVLFSEALDLQQKGNRHGNRIR